MKKLLILIVASALFLHFYPQPEVTKFYNENKAILLNGFTDFSDTNVRLKADKIYNELESKLDSFSPEEVAQLKDVTSSRANVQAFYGSYCQNTKRHAIFHPENQKKVCATISLYSNLL